MGRTLHYSIKKDNGSFTKKELEIMFSISKRYNSDEMLADINAAYKTDLKDLWSCENFWLGIGAYYPNWQKFKTSSEGWDFVNNRIEELEKTMPEIDAIFQAKKEGIIIFHNENYKSCFKTFTKVQGNEFNALLVFKALIEISKQIPKATLHVSDEGEFLLCPLKIKNGLVLPEINDLIENIQHYSMLMMLSKNYEGNIISKLKHTEFKNKCFKQDIYVENTYGDMSKYIDESLRNLQEIEKRLSGVCKNENDLYIHNIDHLEKENWFKPETFVRSVNVEKFLNYKMSEGTLMDGFSGAAFGLSDEDSEQESYNMIAKVFDILGKAGFNNGDAKILGANE